MYNHPHTVISTHAFVGFLRIVDYCNIMIAKLATKRLRRAPSDERLGMEQKVQERASAATRNRLLTWDEIRES